MRLGKGLILVPAFASAAGLVAVCVADWQESSADSNRGDRGSVWDGDRETVIHILFCVAHSQLSTKQNIPQSVEARHMILSILQNQLVQVLEEKRFYVRYNL